MEIRRYTDSDYIIVSNWYRERNMIPVAKEILPPTGFVVPGVACCYLYNADSKLAIFDGCISNPNTTRRERIKALDLIMTQLLLEAKSLGCKTAISLVQHPTMKQVCQRARFSDIGEYKMFSKEL